MRHLWVLLLLLPAAVAIPDRCIYEELSNEQLCLSQARTVSNEFYSQKNNLNGITAYLTTETNEGFLMLRLIHNGAAVTEAAAVPADGQIRFVFEPIADSENKTYTAEFRSDFGFHCLRSIPLIQVCDNHGLIEYPA